MSEYNQKSAKNALRGAQNKSTGELFEKLIISSCAYYRERKAALIEKTPEPFRITGSVGQGKFTGFFTRQAQPDFKGTLAGGRAIVFDAKATSTEKIPVASLTDEQKDTLLLHDELGAVSGVMMCFGFNRFAFMPIKKFLCAKELNGHAYWTAKECADQNAIIEKRGNLLYFMEVPHD